MAGSYNHATNDDGSLRDPLDMRTMLENAGACYEAIEEMYGMIWFLASYVKNLTADTKLDGSPHTIEGIVKNAEKAYKIGIERSPTDRPAMY